jgi:hypothetical protein
MAYKDLMFAKESALRETALSTSELGGGHLKLCKRLPPDLFQLPIWVK